MHAGQQRAQHVGNIVQYIYEVLVGYVSPTSMKYVSVLVYVL